MRADVTFDGLDVISQREVIGLAWLGRHVAHVDLKCTASANGTHNIID